MGYSSMRFAQFRPVFSRNLGKALGAIPVLCDLIWAHSPNSAFTVRVLADLVSRLQKRQKTVGVLNMRLNNTSTHLVMGTSARCAAQKPKRTWCFSLGDWKICFSPRGSVCGFEGGVLLSFSLGLAARTFWSDL